MSDLLQRCVDAYWAREHGMYGLHSSIRMARAFAIIAAEIREWAPDAATSKMCHLAVNEVANRLLEHAENRADTKSEPASS